MQPFQHIQNMRHFSQNNVFVLGFNVFEKIDIFKYRKLPLSFRDEYPNTFQVFWFSKKIIISFYLLSWQISFLFGQSHAQKLEND